MFRVRNYLTEKHWGLKIDLVYFLKNEGLALQILRGGGDCMPPAAQSGGARPAGIP